jgi:chemotaxis protein histidine kinase CheA
MNPNDSSSEGKEMRAQMAQSLSKMQSEAREKGLNMPDLDAAIAALKSNQIDDMVRDLDAATTDLEKMKEMSETLQQLQQQMKEGKDLPEQLKLGQPQQAQQSLKKMMDQLKSANLSQEQMQKMLDEVSRSVDPASPYGKAAEHLKDAVKAMKDGKKADASQCMAQASDELQKAIDQMQDAQALADAMAALKNAETAIATRCNWGEKPGMKQGNKIGFGQGSRGGPGVGTWTDENSTFYPEITERWDNSGVNRPDMDGRGITDRDKPQLGDNIAPTKVKGQITPGGSMPSITLKGVSIKGQSTVDYQSAAEAAQTAAQSALNQDQVPRAYQGAVKDYFDDLKK